MKWWIILLVIIAAYMSSCRPAVYYQLYKTESNDVDIKGYGLVFENEDVRITYDFWSQYGDSGFFIYT